jgi:hypothetical protein
MHHTKLGRRGLKLLFGSCYEFYKHDFNQVDYEKDQQKLSLKRSVNLKAVIH